MRWNKKTLTISYFVLILFLFSGLVTAFQIPELNLITTTESYDPVRYEAAKMIKETWEELGIEIEIEPLEFSALMNRVYNQQDFDMVIAGWSGRVDRLDPQHFLSILHSEQTAPGGNNPGNYVNPEYDELFTKQVREFEPAERRGYVLEMQEIAMEDQPINVLFHRDEVLAYNHEKFRGFVPMAGEGIYTELLPFDVRSVDDDGFLTIGTSQEPDNINPLGSITVWGWKFMRLYYDKLVRLTPDQEPEPWAAESVEPINDSTIEVKLRSDMKFHDGEPVTVSDVKFSYDYYIEQDFGYFRPFYEPLKKVKIIDENTLHFILDDPASFFITVTFSQIPILPKHHWEDIENAQNLAPDEVPTVGSGPLKFDVYDRGEYKRLIVFEDYFRADEIDIEGIDYNIYESSDDVSTALLEKEVDMTAWRLEPSQIPRVKAEDHLTLASVPDFGFYHLIYNLRKAPLDDVRLRRALAHAIPYEKIVDNLLEGRGERGISMIGKVNTFWHNPNVPIFDYDLEKAREKLEKAGYWVDEDGNLNFPAPENMD